MALESRINPGDDTELALAVRLARGVSRWLNDLGLECLTEFGLQNGRRVDVIGLDCNARFTIVEIKTSEADFRSDAKWPEYLDFCDRFFFAVPETFPHELLPDEHGLIVADGFGAAALRDSDEAPMNAARRAAQLRRFALTAAARLRGLTDPRID
jgi:hypothetical protein